jgi:hypothetical protein
MRGTRLRLVERNLADVPESVRELVRELADRYNEQASELASGELGGRVAQLAPPDHAAVVDQLERRPGRLMGAVALGAATVYRTVTGGHVGLRITPAAETRVALAEAA